MKQPLNALVIHDGDAPQDAVLVSDGVYMARATSNSYLITTQDGDVVINTGLPHQGPEIRQRYARVSDAPIRYVIFTQSHADHIGGWQHFTRTGAEMIAQANFAVVRDYWTRLHAFYASRSGRLWARDRDPRIKPAAFPPDPVPAITFTDAYELALGGRRFTLLSVPGGETTDSLAVWLPDEGTVFTGNLTGPLFGHVPNLYTLRGDKIRSAAAFIASVDRVIGLDAELLITGHGDPVRGAGEVRARLTQVRDATEYLREATIAGMNAGTDLWTLMRQVTLPPALDIPQGHGKVPWIVRAIWEEHAGWFRYESTTELYDVPPPALYAELAELAGGTVPLVARGQAHLAAGRPEQALHFAEIALAAVPDDADALALTLAAHELLLERTGRENFSEVRWLEAEIRDIREKLT